MTTLAENALAPEQKLPKAPPVLPDDEVLYELADLFRVFGDSTRIKILYALHDDELCVQDIANAVQLSQSAVSHQLRVLKDTKLVRFRRDVLAVFSGVTATLCLPRMPVSNIKMPSFSNLRAATVCGR